MSVIGLMIRQRILTTRKLEIGSEQLHLAYRQHRELRNISRMACKFKEPVKIARKRYNEENNKYTEMLTLAIKYKDALRTTNTAPIETSNNTNIKIIEYFPGITTKDDIDAKLKEEEKKVANLKEEWDNAKELEETQTEAYAELKTETEEEFEIENQRLGQELQYINGELEKINQVVPNKVKELAPQYA